MSSSTAVVFHGRKASNNGFSLFVNAEMLAATNSKVVGGRSFQPVYEPSQDICGMDIW